MFIQAEELKKECSLKQEEFIKQEVKQLYNLLERFISEIRKRENYNTETVWCANHVKIDGQEKNIDCFNYKSLETFKKEIKQLGYEVNIICNRDSFSRTYLQFTFKI